MVTLEITRIAQGKISVKGDLTLASINKKTVQAIEFKNSRYSENTISIDLSAVNNSDSAGLALIIEWIKLSQLHYIKLNFEAIPEQLLTLAKLSGFDNNSYFQ